MITIIVIVKPFILRVILIVREPALMSGDNKTITTLHLVILTQSYVTIIILILGQTITIPMRDISETTTIKDNNYFI